MERIESSKIVLEAKQLSKEVTSPEGLLTILDNVDLSVSVGESIAVVGVSGAGKSTLLGLLAGLDVPSKGQVWLNGQELSELDEDGRAALRSGQVGFVFQSFHLIPSLTALENVMLPLELMGKENADDEALSVLAKVGLLERKGHYPRQLSGGEKQRVAIARAFVTRPAVLFADEPTGNLDPEVSGGIYKLFQEINRSGTSILMATHDHSLIESSRDRIIQCIEGKISDSATTGSIKPSPSPL